MASDTVQSRTRLRSKTEDDSSSNKVTARSFFGRAKRGQSFDLDREDRSHQLQESLLDPVDSIALASRPDGTHSTPEGADSEEYRKRAKRWRRGMRLPKGRSRKKTLNDKFIDSSKNTPHYVKHYASENSILL